MCVNIKRRDVIGRNGVMTPYKPDVDTSINGYFSMPNWRDLVTVGNAIQNDKLLRAMGSMTGLNDIFIKIIGTYMLHRFAQFVIRNLTFILQYTEKIKYLILN